MSALLDVTLPVFLVIGFGYLTVWRKWLSHDSAEAVMKFTQGFAIPCLLFLATARLDIARHFETALLFSYYAGSVTVFILGILGARVLFNRTFEEAIAIGFAGMFANSVLLGLAVTERAYGADALGANFVIVAFHAPICYFIGITTMEITRNRGGGILTGAAKVARSIAMNPLMIGIALGFAVNLLKIPLPQALETALEMMSRAALPAALFALGGILVRYRPEGDFVQVGFICAMGLVIHPLITIGLGGLSGLSSGATRSAVVTAAMAPGVNAYIFANMFGVAKRVVASAVLIGTAVSILTVSAWLAVLG